MRFTFFASLLLLAGCSSGDKPAPLAPAPPPAAEAPKPTDSRPVVAAFGDSLTAGFGVETGSSYPDFLQKEIDARGLRYRVANLGISGDTTTGGVSRMQIAVGLKPRVVILELGGNDGLRGLPLEKTRENLQTLARTFKAAGAQVVIAGMTLPPNYGPDYVKNFEALYVDLSREMKLPRIPFLLEGVWDQPGLMQGDGIHPTVAGNEKVAKLVMKTLEPLLR